MFDYETGQWERWEGEIPDEYDEEIEEEKAERRRQYEADLRLEEMMGK